MGQAMEFLNAGLAGDDGGRSGVRAREGGGGEGEGAAEGQNAKDGRCVGESSRGKGDGDGCEGQI